MFSTPPTPPLSPPSLLLTPRFLSEPKPSVQAALKDAAAEGEAAAAGQAKARAAAVSGVAGAEGELRELLASSPALAAAAAAGVGGWE